MNKILYFFDLSSIFLLIIIWFTLLLIIGRIKDIGNAIQIGLHRKKEYSMIELKKALLGIESSITALYLTGAFIILVHVIMMLHRLDSPEKLGPYVAYIFLVMFYVIILNIIILPFKIRLKNLIIAYMDENKPEEDSDDNIMQKMYYHLKYHGLTDREAEVARLISLGMSNKEIGKALYISETTVKKHITHIFDKMNLDNRDELTIFIKEI